MGRERATHIGRKETEMTYKQVFDMLKTTNLSVVYNSWEIGSVPALPYIVFTYPNNDDLFADNINYQTIVQLNIELYSKNKDFTSEGTLETVLKNNGIPFQKSSVWIDSENLYQTLYTTEVLING